MRIYVAPKGILSQFFVKKEGSVSGRVNYGLINLVSHTSDYCVIYIIVTSE